MRSRIEGWARLLLGGALLFGSTSVGSCIADELREVSDGLDDVANELNDDRSDTEQFFDDLEDLFD